MKHLMDMTLNELYEELLDDERNKTLEQNREIPRMIRYAEGMLRRLGICRTCNIRRMVNQWSIYCHATCFPQNHVQIVPPEDPTNTLREQPPTLRELGGMLKQLLAAEDREPVTLRAKV